MNIQKLKIENFRGVTDFNYECGRSLNVLVGVNGAGKSTVLYAIDILFSWLVARLRNVNGKGYGLTDDDITVGCGYCCLEVILDSGVMWRLYKQRSTNRKKPEGKTSLEQLTVFANNILLNNEQNVKMASLPLVATYGVTRAVVKSTPVRIHKRHAMDLLDAYNRDGGHVNFQSFFSWFREREDIENEQLRENGVLKEDSQLRAVRTAISEAIPGFDNLKVQRSPRSFIISKNGKKIKFDQLSDGEKSYIALIGDIARKLSMTHPTVKNPLEGSGIVVIDEIDLHLHPQWQHDVVASISKVFRNCQFFVSTHSPVVLSNISPSDKDKVFLLRDGNVMQVTDNLYAKRIDRIMMEEFALPSLRGKEVQDHIDAVWTCLRANDCNSDEFKKNFEWLKENLAPSDSEFMQIVVQTRIINSRRLA